MRTLILVIVLLLSNGLRAGCGSLEGTEWAATMNGHKVHVMFQDGIVTASRDMAPMYYKCVGNKFKTHDDTGYAGYSYQLHGRQLWCMNSESGMIVVIFKQV